MEAGNSGVHFAGLVLLVSNFVKYSLKYFFSINQLRMPILHIWIILAEERIYNIGLSSSLAHMNLSQPNNIAK